MSIRLILILPFALALFSMPAYAEELPLPDEEQEGEVDEGCEVEAVNGGVHCVRGDGEVTWEIQHPSLWDELEDYLAQDEERFPVGPITTGPAETGSSMNEGRVFYAVRGDLIEIDPLEGVVVGRRRMFAPIGSLETAEGAVDQLELVLDFEPERPGAEKVEISVMMGLDAPGPPQNIWFGMMNSFAGRMTAWRDSDWLVERLEDEERSVVFEALLEAYQRDPLNLFLLARLTSEEHAEAFVGSRDGDRLSERAARRWEELLYYTSPSVGPPWQDLVAVSWVLEEDRLGREIGAEVFEVGHRKMLERGIEPERMTNLVSFVITHMRARDVIIEAVDEDDARRVDDLSNRLYLGFPYVEGGHFAWASLAEWLDDHGESGDRWRERARENAEISYSLAGSDSRAADRLIAWQAGLALALLLFPFLIGIQGGIARRRRREEGLNSAPAWVPLLGFRHLLGLLLLIGAMVFCVFSLATHVAVIGKMAAAPLNTMDDTMASPDVRMWLEDLAASPARDELLEISTHEFEALQAGRDIEKKSFMVHLVHEAGTADARATQWELLKSGQLSNPFTSLEIDADQSGAAMDKVPAFGLIPFLGLMAILIFVGTLLGSALPRIGLWTLRLIPGGAPALVPIGGVLLGGVFAALAAFMGADSILTSLSVPAFPRYFGLQEIAVDVITSPNRLWAWLALGTAVVFQAAAVGLELRRGDSDSATD